MQRRKIKNLINQPEFQIRFASYFVWFGLTIAAMLALGLLWWIYDYSQALNASLTRLETPEAALSLAMDHAVNLGIYMGAFILIITAFSFATSFYLSHRISGPIGVIKNTLSSFADGHTEKRIHLRKNDELKALAEEINAFLDKMAQKSR